MAFRLYRIKRSYMRFGLIGSSVLGFRDVGSQIKCFSGLRGLGFRDMAFSIECFRAFCA